MWTVVSQRSEHKDAPWLCCWGGHCTAKQFMLCLEGLLGATVLILKMTGDDSIL